MAFDAATALRALRARVTTDGGSIRPVLILSHDNPDPDALAAALGLRRLLESTGLKAILGLGGIIGRAENRAMVRELQIELLPFEQIDLARVGAVALIDTQPGTGNNSLPAGHPVDVVIDHHPQRYHGAPAPWHDVRPDFGATATIVFGYLRDAGVPLDPQLATAMLYALKSETRDLGREAGAEERDAYVELMRWADFERLYAITNPKLPREHFVALDRALRAATLWGDLVAINLGALDYPDLVAEIADLMLQYDRARWVLCVGRHAGAAYLSVRTDLPDAAAGHLTRRVVGAEGAAGGHGMIAGGRLFAGVHDDDALRNTYNALVERFRAELAIDAAPVPLL